MKISPRVDVPFPKQLAEADVSHRRPRREAPFRGERDGFDVLGAARDDNHTLAGQIEAENISDELALLRNEARRVALVGQRVAEERYGAGGLGDVAVVVFFAADQYEHYH